MRILFLIGQLGYGGAESVVSTLTSQLAIRGHQVTLISHLGNQFYEVDKQVHLIDVRDWQYDTFKGSVLVRYYKKAANRFLDFINIKRIFKERSPEVVISFLVSWGPHLVFLCGKRIPLIFAERNAMVYPHGRANFINKQIIYRMAYAVQVMSRYDKAWVRNMYRRVYPMPNPLRFKPMDKVLLDNSFEYRSNILACGRITPQKGFDKLIIAFSKLESIFSEWSVDICGPIEDDDYYQSLVKLIHCYKLDGRINFLGGRKDVEQLMQTHSVFCLSSQHEGFPNVLVEAMANGMACVSFDIVTGPSEIIIDGLDGLIVEDQNVQELANGLRILMADSQLRYILGSHAIENIKRFEKDKVVDKWEKMFINIIESFKER